MAFLIFVLQVPHFLLQLDNVTVYLKDNEEMYKMILASQEPLIFLEKLNIMLQENLFLFFKKSKNKNKNTTKLNISFFVDGILNRASRYFYGNVPYDLNGLNIYMKKMV